MPIDLSFFAQVVSKAGIIDDLNHPIDVCRMKEALGKLIEECNHRFAGIDSILEILINDSNVSRKELLDEIRTINRRLDEQL